MGYNVSINSSTVILPDHNLPKILEIWKDLNKPENNSQKRGGSWSGGEQTSWNYSWMDPDYDEKVTSVNEVLEMLGFETEAVEPDGSLAINYYDSKTGQEELFFQAIAGYIPQGQYIEWVGEDDDHWRWFFNGMDMQIQQGTVTYR